LETCCDNDLLIANTFFEHPPEQQVIFRSIGVPPLDVVERHRFAQLDYVLLAKRDLGQARDVRSDRLEPLASHHYLLEALLVTRVEPPRQRTIPRRFDRSALKEDSTSRRFASVFQDSLNDTLVHLDKSDVNAMGVCITEAFQHAEKLVLPLVSVMRHKPWISQHTLDLIESRREARRHGDAAGEQDLQKQVRSSAKLDRRNWLENLASEGTWSAIRKLRRGKPHSQGRLQAASGDLVASEDRADTFSLYCPMGSPPCCSS
jgi:hypothetical protein